MFQRTLLSRVMKLLSFRLFEQSCFSIPFLGSFCKITANICEHANFLSPESVSPRPFKPCKSRLGRRLCGRAKARTAPHNKTAARQKDLHKRTYENPHHTHTHTKKRGNNQTDGVGRPKAAPPHRYGCGARSAPLSFLCMRGVGFRKCFCVGPFV